MPGFYLFKHSGGLIVVHGALVWALAHEQGPSARLLARPALVRLGEASYSLYILQAPMMTWWLVVTRAYHLSLPLEGRFGRAGYVAVLVVVSLIVHRALELPAREWIRARLTRLNPKPVV